MPNFLKKVNSCADTASEIPVRTGVNYTQSHSTEDATAEGLTNTRLNVAGPHPQLWSDMERHHAFYESINDSSLSNH